MPRPKKNKKISFNGYGLKPEEDEELINLLNEKDMSAAMVVRALLREWMKSGGSGVLRYSTK